MAAFSDDDEEGRRRNMRIIGSAALLILLLAVVGTACTLYSPEKETPSSHLATLDTTAAADAPQLRSTAKAIQIMCGSTDYKRACISSLNKAARKNATDPKELVKAAVAAVLDEISTAFRRTRLLADKDPRVRGAVEDCRQLFEDAKDEIERSLDGIVSAAGIEHIPKKSRDIRAWLSAVMSYQQTCIDGFPDGELKAKLKKTLKAARELTSNSLAIVKDFSIFLEMLEFPESTVTGRKLLAGQNEEQHQFDDDGVPSWVHEDNRRVLKEVNANLKPNVTVAKDGSGNHTTISMALAKMPTEYSGRFIFLKYPHETAKFLID